MRLFGQAFPRIVLAALAAATLTAVACWAQEVPRMGTGELVEKLGRSDLVVIDVRAGRDWSDAKTKIKGAVRENPNAVTDWAGVYPKDKTLVLYCA